MNEKFKKVLQAGVLAGSTILGTEKADSFDPEKLRRDSSIEEVVRYFHENSISKKDSKKFFPSDLYESSAIIFYNERTNKFMNISARGNYREIPNDLTEANVSKLKEEVKKTSQEGAGFYFEVHNHPSSVLRGIMGEFFRKPRAVLVDENKLLTGPSTTDCISNTSDKAHLVNIIVEPGGIWVCGKDTTEHEDSVLMSDETEEQVNVARRKIIIASQSKNPEEVLRGIEEFKRQFEMITGFKVTYLPIDSSNETIIRAASQYK